jgi:hypothetical protein
MALRYVLDENLWRPLWTAVLRHNAAKLYPLDAIPVGAPPDLPLGSLDPDILAWAEREERILVSFDRSSLPVCLANHLQAGQHSPGVFLIRPASLLPEVLDFLVLADQASEPWEWRDRCRFIPF